MTDADVPSHLLGFVDDAGGVPDRASLPSYTSPVVGRRLCHVSDLHSFQHYRSRELRVTAGGAADMRDLVGARRSGIPITQVTARVQDPSDPVGNVRRFVLAARDAGLPDEVEVHVEVQGPPLGSWLTVADEVAAIEGALVITIGTPDAAGWIEAALDRELGFALRGCGAPDALEALETTARLWGDPDDLDAARRWCRSWATGDVPAAITYLEGLS